MQVRKIGKCSLQVCLAALVAIAGLSFQLLAIDNEGRIEVNIEAHPSANCFPPSSLQQTELEKDFVGVCPECIVLLPKGRPVDYRIVVEDPGFGWVVTIIDRQGTRIARLRWAGPLDHALEQAAQIVKVQ